MHRTVPKGIIQPKLSIVPQLRNSSLKVRTFAGYTARALLGIQSQTKLGHSKGSILDLLFRKDTSYPRALACMKSHRPACTQCPRGQAKGPASEASTFHSDLWGWGLCSICPFCWIHNDFQDHQCSHLSWSSSKITISSKARGQPRWCCTCQDQMFLPQGVSSWMGRDTYSRAKEKQIPGPDEPTTSL